MERVDVVGSGAWGTTIALLLAGKGMGVRIVCRRPEVVRDINETHENSAHLPGVKLPESIEARLLSETSLSGSGYVVLAVTSQHMRETLRQPAFQGFGNGSYILHAVKGLEHYLDGEMSGRRMSQVIADELMHGKAGPGQVAVMSGPNLATEIAAGKMAETVIACKDRQVAEMWSKLFAAQYRFVPYVSDDVAGVELCGALKNVVAIACGMADGLALGENTKAAIMRQGIAEMVSIGKRYGAMPETFNGPAGIYDMIVTCHSPDSRNRLVGERVARGKALDAVLHELISERRGEPEGPEMAKVVCGLNGNLGLHLFKAVSDVLYSGSDAKSRITSLGAYSQPPR